MGLVATVQASTISGTSVIDTPDTSISDSKIRSSSVQGFEEVINYTLTADLTLDDDTVLTAGTEINSYLIFLYPGNNTQVTGASATFTFDNQILGVVDVNNSTALKGSCFSSDLTYFSSWYHARLETNDSYSITDAYSITATLNATTRMGNTKDYDYIRVITVSSASTTGTVPEPATMMLLGFGLLGFSGVARRKK